MKPKANRSEFNRRSRLSEAQNHRCAICTTGIEPLAYSDDPDRACMVAFDPKRPKTWENSIAVCAACSGEIGNFEPMNVWERFQAGTYTPFRPNRAIRRQEKQVEYPETIPAIEAYMAKHDFVYRGGNIPKFFRFAPPERAETIAESLMRKPVRPRKFRKCRGRVRRNGHDQSLSEAQNHRCCYCTERMSDDRKSWRFATIEHVIETSKGGKSIFENLVMACLVCNMMRSRLRMTAYEYAEFAALHPDHILVELKRLDRKREIENLRRRSGKHGGDTHNRR